MKYMQEVPFVLGLTVLNLGALWVATYFELLLFLDTLMTASAALYFGTKYGWQGGVVAGVVVGIVTNLLTALAYPGYKNFVHVNALCGAAWGLSVQFFPPPEPTAPKLSLLIYVVGLGSMVGLASVLASTPMRIRKDFKTDHLLDQVSGGIWRNPGARPIKFLRILVSEFLLSHGPDKILSTTFAFACLLVIGGTLKSPDGPIATYRDLIEFLTAYYFLALAYSVKTLGVKLPAGKELLVILGPLGFLAVLMILPSLGQLLAG